MDFLAYLIGGFTAGFFIAFRLIHWFECAGWVKIERIKK